MGCGNLWMAVDMILRAKYILPLCQDPIADGAVVIHNGSITAVGSSQDVQATHSGPVRDLGEVVLLPGLINAHCHLDYTDMRGQVPWHGVFIDWLLRITDLKRQWTDEQYVASIRKGAAELARWGTTTVVNSAAQPHLIPHVEPLPMRLWWCMELIDLLEEDTAEQKLRAAILQITELKRGHGGLAPHAPFTASPELYRITAHAAHERKLLLTTHLIESAEEDDMFRRGCGPMFDRYSRLGRNMSDCKRVGVMQLMAEYGVLGPYCLAVHANCLTPIDLNLLSTTGTHVVHCPKAHQFFQRPKALLPLLRLAGINVCLGTDSLASNDTLSLFAEMQRLSMNFVDLAPSEILAMVTTNAAKALNAEDKLGKLAEGAWADLIAVPLDGPVIDPYEAAVYSEKPVVFSMVGGQEIINETK